MRKEHDDLEGTIRPLDDAFWDSYYPPNGWRCRCYVVQTAERPTDDKDMPKITPKDVGPEFKINVGKGGEVFKETEENKGKPHPYFALAKTAGSETKKAFEYAKLAAKPHTVYKGKNGGKVSINVFTDKRKPELLGNYRDAKLLADRYGLEIELAPLLNGRILFKEKSPEYLINGIKGDRKTPTKINYKKRIKSANDQKAEIVVINLSVNGDNLENAEAKIHNILKFPWVHKFIKKVYIIDGQQKIKVYERKKTT